MLVPALNLVIRIKFLTPDLIAVVIADILSQQLVGLVYLIAIHPQLIHVRFAQQVIQPVVECYRIGREVSVTRMAQSGSV